MCWVGTEELQGAVTLSFVTVLLTGLVAGDGEGNICDEDEALSVLWCMSQLRHCSRVQGNLSTMADLAWITSHHHWRQAHFQPVSNVSRLCP